MQKIVKNLKETIIDAVAEDLKRRGRPKYFEKNSTIYMQGDFGSDLFFIETGQVELSSATLAGRKVVTTHLGPGDLIGEIALLDQSGRSVTATAISNVTGHLLGFEDFRGFLSANPDAHFALTVDLCGKLRSANQILEDLTNKDGSVRLTRCLLRLAAKFGRSSGASIEIPIRLSQSEIGDISGLTRANVNRHMRTLSEQGFLTFNKDQLTLHKVQELEQRSEE